MTVIDNKYELGDFVYLVTDNEQVKRIVTMIKVFPGGVMYQLSAGKEYSDHYECEMSDTENIEMKVK